MAGYHRTSSEVELPTTALCHHTPAEYDGFPQELAGTQSPSCTKAVCSRPGSFLEIQCFGAMQTAKAWRYPEQAVNF